MNSPRSGNGASVVFIGGALGALCCVAPLAFPAILAATTPLFFALHETLFTVAGAIAIAGIWIWVSAGSRGQSPVKLIAAAFAQAAPSLLLISLFAVALSTFYLVALPAERYGAFSWGALQLLTPGDALAAVVIGTGVPLTVALNVAVRKTHPAQRTLTFGGAIAGLLPSSLCCTTLIPSALALFGASAPAIMHTTGRYQSFFAEYATAFIAFAVGAVLFSFWLAVRTVTGTCARPVRSK